MMKYVFVTGGVVSSLGKGTTATIRFPQARALANGPAGVGLPQRH